VIANINVGFHHRDYWFRCKECIDVKVSNINYTFGDDGIGLTAGFASVELSSRIGISHFSTHREASSTGIFNAFLFTNSQVDVSHGQVLNYANGTPLTVAGTTSSEVTLESVVMKGALTIQIAIGAGAVGTLRIANSLFDISTGYVGVFTGPLGVILNNNLFLNGNFDVVAAVPMFASDSTGVVEFSNNTIGFNDATSNSTYVFLMTGTGPWRMSHNRIIGHLAATLTAPGSTQEPTLLGGNTYIDTGTNLTEWVRNAVVTPAGAVTPKFRGELYLDTVTGIWYKAAGYTNADWKALN